MEKLFEIPPLLLQQTFRDELNDILVFVRQKRFKATHTHNRMITLECYAMTIRNTKAFSVTSICVLPTRNSIF